MNKELTNPLNILEAYLTALSRYCLIAGSLFLIIALINMAGVDIAVTAVKLNTLLVGALLTLAMLLLTKLPSFSPPKKRVVFLPFVLFAVAMIGSSYFYNEFFSAAQFLLFYPFIISISRLALFDFLESGVSIALFMSFVMPLMLVVQFTKETTYLSKETFLMVADSVFYILVVGLIFFFCLILMINLIKRHMNMQVSPITYSNKKGNSTVTIMTILLTGIIFTLATPFLPIVKITSQVGLYASAAFIIPFLVCVYYTAINTFKLSYILWDMVSLSRRIKNQ